MTVSAKDYRRAEVMKLFNFIYVKYVKRNI